MAAAAILTFAYCCGTANAVTIPISGNFSGVGSGSPSSETFTGTGHDTTFGDFNATETNDGLLPGDTGQATGSGSFDPNTSTVSGNYSGFISGPGPDLGLVDGLTVTPAATPLPAALPIFLGGAGLIGFVARRRKQKFA